MEFLIIVWVIAVGLCWFASLEWAYHYGRAKQAREFLRRKERWKKRRLKKWKPE